MFKTLPFPIKIEDPVTYLRLMETCSKIFNDYVDWAFEKKSYNKLKCHKETYFLLRKKYPEIVSCMLQTIRDVALEAVKATKFKFRPVKKKFSSIRYDKRNMTLRSQQLTFSGIGKRNKVILNIPEYYKIVFDDKSWIFKGGTIGYNHRTKHFTANLIFKKDSPPLIDNPKVLGIDRGIYNLAVLSDGTIFNSKEVRKQQRKHLYNRTKIQAKGAPSSKRKLRKLSGKEKRFSKNFNHCISKKIANYDCGTFVFEDLKNIRNKKVKSKNVKANKWLSSWAFFQMEQFSIYKAEALGKKVVHINPQYTSQTCSCCGHIDKGNRIKSIFKCLRCGFTKHADVNAAINIENKYTLSIVLETKSIEQAVVLQPIVSVIQSPIFQFTLDTNHQKNLVV